MVLAAIGVMARLGVWQLDRREQRRARNADIVQKLALPPIVLNDEGLPPDLSDVKNRLATARGEYDLSRQVTLTQQSWNNSPGFHLITPLVFQGASQAVLVDRGWLPARELAVENWSQYDVTEPVTVTGYIKLSQTVPGATGDSRQVTGEPETEWYRVDIAEIQTQIPYELLPVYLQQAPAPGGEVNLPFRSELDNDLSEGPHLSYAIQWFIFATILGVGYVHYVGKRDTVNGRR